MSAPNNSAANSADLTNSGMSAAETAISTVTDLLTGVTLPKPVKENAWKAFSRLCSALVDVPVTALEGRVAERRAVTEGRVRIISAATGQIVDSMTVGAEYADAAVKRFASKIVREQKNLDQVAKVAALQLGSEAGTTPDAEGVPALEDDWLNAFEREAAEKSTEEMQLLFGRILAGEIRHPKSFAIKTVRLISQIDSDTAIAFKRLCSIAISLQVGPKVWDARVSSLAGNANTNALRPYGLSYDQLNVLNEFGLVIADYNSWMSYEPSVAKNNQVHGLLRFEGKDWVLRPTPERAADAELKFHGVALTRAGRELMGIVDIEHDGQYRNAFERYLLDSKLALEEFTSVGL